MIDDYREWMTRNGIEKLTQSETDDSPFGEMIEFRAHRMDVTAYYAIPRDEFLDAKTSVMPIVLERLVAALDYSRADYPLPPQLGRVRPPVH